MSKTIISVFALCCLLCCSLEGLEVRTLAPAVEAGADRVHYDAFAKRFTDTLKTHPPVSDCHVLLHTSALADFVDQIEIAVQIDRDALIKFLNEQHNIRFVSQKDQDHYLDSLKTAIRKSATEIFTDIQHESIKVSLTYADGY